MLTVLQCGYAYTHLNGVSIYRPSGTPHYVFVYFRSPSEFATPDGFLPCQGHFLLLEPGFGHHYRSVCSPFINDWVHFRAAEGTAGGQYLEAIGFPLNTPVRLPDPSLVQRHIRAMNTLDAQAPAWRAEVNAAHMVSILDLLGGAAQADGEQRPQHRYYQQLAKIRSELYRIPQPGLRIETLAEKAGLSLSRFQHLYREIFRCTVGEDIAQGRLHRAKYLLDNSVLPISLVAEESGYTNETHMIRHFNKYVGATPAQYRRRARAQEGP